MAVPRADARSADRPPRARRPRCPRWRRRSCSSGPATTRSKLRWTLTRPDRRRVVLAFTQALRERVVRPLQTVSNLLAAMREEDFSIRARGARRRRPARRSAPRGQRARRRRCASSASGRSRRRRCSRRSWPRSTSPSSPSTSAGELQLVNRFGERLLGQPEPRLRGRRAEELGLAPFLDDGAPQILEAQFPGRRGPLGDPAQHVPPGRRAAPAPRARRRQPPAARGGAPGLAAPDPRARPRAQQLARADPVDRRQPPEAGRPEPSRRADWRDDLRHGLSVIASRAEALSRFTDRLRAARAPAAARARARRRRARCSRRVASLETRLPVGVIPGPVPHGRRPTPTSSSSSSSTSCATPPTPRSRRRAASPSAGSAGRGSVEIWVADDGPGLPNDDQPLRAVLHDEARRLGDRPRAVAPDRRGARRQPLAREPARPPRLDRPPAP